MIDLIKYQPGLLAKLAEGGLSLDVFTRDILLITEDVAGTAYQDIQAIVAAVNPDGDTLQLKREPLNEHDEFAIAIWKSDVKCGYVPRRKNEVIARLMDAGKTINARSLPFDWEEGMFLSIVVEIFLRG